MLRHQKKIESRTVTKRTFRIPFDRNRVILTPVAGRDYSAYINASFIEGYDLGYNSECFILTQDPIESTQRDFWRMVLEHNIVMSFCRKWETRQTLPAARNTGHMMIKKPLTITSLSNTFQQSRCRATSNATLSSAAPKLAKRSGRLGFNTSVGATARTALKTTRFHRFNRPVILLLSRWKPLLPVPGNSKPVPPTSIAVRLRSVAQFWPPSVS